MTKPEIAMFEDITMRTGKYLHSLAAYLNQDARNRTAIDALWEDFKVDMAHVFTRAEAAQ